MEPLPTWWRRRDVQLFCVGVALYVATRVIGLTRFPIYFFSDEAVQSTLADALAHNWLRDENGVFVPPFFRNDQRYNLSLSVYAQIPGVLLFGTSVFVNRLTAVIFGTIGMLAMTLTVRLLGVRLWWITPLVLASIPSWFLHSRTGFEVVIMVAAYASFLAAYLLYRFRSPRFAVAAVACGAATFYAYANGQGLMLVSGLLLLVSDFGYHRSHVRDRWVTLPSLTVAVVAIGQYVRERTLHPSSFSDHLRSLDSYWYDDISVPSKLWQFVTTYLRGLDPRYWFAPTNDVDLDRHVMFGMGHVWWMLAPFVAVGLWACFRNWRSPKHRVVLIAIIATPFSGALVEIGITRVLVMVVPITLLSCIGIDTAVREAAAAPGLQRVAVSLIAVGLAALSLGTMHTALTEGDRWSADYGLYGMQWGATEVFGEIADRLHADERLSVVVSPSWANNTNVFADFFLDDQGERVKFAGIDSVVVRRAAFDADTLFVLTPADYQQAIGSELLVVAAPELVIPWPDGRPGFYFTRLEYVDGVDEIFAAEAAERQRLIESSAVSDGEPVAVFHSRIDIGTIADALDGDPYTLMRGLDANPFVMDVRFPSARRLRTVALTTGTMDFDLLVVVYGATGRELGRNLTEHRGLPADPTVIVDLPRGSNADPLQATRVRLEISEPREAEVHHIHVREVSFG